jgi:hypothetical protein
MNARAACAGPRIVVRGPKKPAGATLKPANGSVSLAKCSKIVLGSCAEVR